MPFRRRLLLYLFGVVIGLGLAWWFYGARLTSGAWLPEHKVKQRLRSTLIDARPLARAQLAAWPCSLADLRAAMDSADVDLPASRRTPDSIYYAVNARVRGRDAHLTIAVRRDFDTDSTAVLWDLRPR
jgi:hypothetical protein